MNNRQVARQIMQKVASQRQDDYDIRGLVKEAYLQGVSDGMEKEALAPLLIPKLGLLGAKFFGKGSLASAAGKGIGAGLKGLGSAVKSSWGSFANQAGTAAGRGMRAARYAAPMLNTPAGVLGMGGLYGGYRALTSDTARGMGNQFMQGYRGGRSGGWGTPNPAIQENMMRGAQAGLQMRDQMQGAPPPARSDFNVPPLSL